MHRVARQKRSFRVTNARTTFDLLTLVRRLAFFVEKTEMPDSAPCTPSMPGPQVGTPADLMDEAAPNPGSTITGETSVPRSRNQCCPVCSSTEVGLRCCGGLPSEEKTRVLAFLQNAYRIYECNSCGYVFKDSILDEHQFALLYGDMDCQRWESSQLYPTERLLVRALRRKLASGSSILDFGCSSGRLLAELVGSFRCSGFEINEHASQIAASKGIEIIPGRCIRASGKSTRNFASVGGTAEREWASHRSDWKRGLLGCRCGFG